MGVRSSLASLRVFAVRVERQHQRIGDLEREMARLLPQVAALEARCEDLRVRLEDRGYAADAGEVVQARSLVDDVRAEHARVRARISAAVVFEERLRVLEERAGVDSATGRPVPPPPAGSPGGPAAVDDHG